MLIPFNNSLLSAPPLMIIEILHRIVQTFIEYFGECSDGTIKENLVIVFEVSPSPAFVYPYPREIHFSDSR